MVEPLDELVQCAEFGSHFEATAAAERLKAVGIEASVSGDPAWNVAPHLVTSPGFKVVVRARDQDQAVDVLSVGDNESPRYTRFRDRPLGMRIAGWLTFWLIVVPIAVFFVLNIVTYIVRLIS